MILPEIKVSVSFDRNVKKSELFKITSSKTAEELFRKIFNTDTFDWQEEVIILCLNNSNKVVGFYKLAKGGICSTIVDPRMIFTIALKCCATSIIVAHNHPSGKLIPSEADKTITKKIKEGGKILEITLLDHLILTDESYFSFADEGIL